MSETGEITNDGILAAIAEETKDEVKETPAVAPVAETPVEEPKPVITVKIKKEPVKSVIGATPPQKAKRARDSVTVHLENLKNSPNAMGRIAAWVRIIEVVTRFPKKSVLDEILTFFKENKDEAFLSESVALQGINTVEMTVHQKLRIFYTVMIGLAKRVATRKNTSIEVIRNIFASDELANWVAIQLDKRTR